MWFLSVLLVFLSGIRIWEWIVAVPKNFASVDDSNPRTHFRDSSTSPKEDVLTIRSIWLRLLRDARGHGLRTQVAPQALQISLQILWKRRPQSVCRKSRHPLPEAQWPIQESLSFEIPLALTIQVTIALAIQISITLEVPIGLSLPKRGRQAPPPPLERPVQVRPARRWPIRKHCGLWHDLEQLCETIRVRQGRRPGHGHARSL